MKDRIRAVREASGLSIAKFGERLGVSKGVIANLEYGRVEPSPFVIRAICSAFNVDYGWLKDGIGEMFSDTDDSAIAAIEVLLDGENEFAKAIVRAVARFEEKDWENFKALYEAVKKELG